MELSTKVALAIDSGDITEGEARSLETVFGHVNYGEWGYSAATVYDIADEMGCSTDSAKGYVGSLVKKGYFVTHDWGKNSGVEERYQHTIHLTKKGWRLHPDWSEEEEKEPDRNFM